MKLFLKSTLLTSAALLSLAFTPGAYAADSLEIKNFIGSINWSNGPISVEFEQNKGDTSVSGRSDIVIDGGVGDIDGSDCKSSYGQYDISWFGKKSEGRFGGYKNLEDYPILNISLPENAELIIRDSIVFTQGTPDVEMADLELRYCGNVTLGDITDTLALDSRGSADLRVGETGQIAANLKGSGDLEGGSSGDVILKSRGSGDVELQDVASLEMSLHGSGDLEAGNVDGSVELSSHGSGDVELGDVDGSLEYSGHGSGDFEARSINGAQAYLKSHGSGDIDIAGGSVETLDIIVRGSATVEFEGEAESANLSASGSGDIRVDRVSGAAEINTSGSGDIDIRERG